LTGLPGISHRYSKKNRAKAIASASEERRQGMGMFMVLIGIVAQIVGSLAKAGAFEKQK
jgi:hypothetical protein